METRGQNPSLSPVLNVIVWITTAVLALATVALLALPGFARTQWPWDILPFNGMFVGAIYAASLVAVGMLALNNRWAPARIVLPMMGTITLYVLVVSILYRPRFNLAQWTTPVWFVVYALPAASSAIFMWRYRQLPPAYMLRIPRGWRTFLAIQGIIPGLYGVALAAYPAAATYFWPWPVDDFHGRVYAGVFLAIGLGSLMAARAAAPIELRALGMGEAVLGTVAILGLALVERSAHRVNWALPGTWLWISLFAALVVGGLLTLNLSRRGQ